MHLILQRKNLTRAGIALVAASAMAARAQVADFPQPSPAPAPAPAPATSSPAPAAPSVAPQPQSQSGNAGSDLPFFDPGTELFSWNGRHWNVNNNRLFAARFEKYLNAPEATTEEDRQYQAIIHEILNRLAPGRASRENLDYAFRLLTRGSNYDIDARLCDALADAVYTVWAAQRQQQRLVEANKAMQFEVMQLEAQMRLNASATQAAKNAQESGRRRRQAGGQEQQPQQTSAEEEAADAKKAALEISDWKTRRHTEIVARQKANDLKRELSEIQAKVEYQALIVQFFLQRRFQHVLVATRFYRAIFSDGESKLNVGDETRQLFTSSTGFAPTVSTLDSLANEAIRDVREGVRAFDYLLEKDELESASKRLAEAFTVGEYLPEIRTLSREKKRRSVRFVQRSNELLAKMEMKDYGGAEKIVEELSQIARDFDATRARTGIETAKTVARMRLAKARNAALSGDRDTLEKELAAATELWPLNPELAEISQRIFDQGDVQQRALLDLDQLIAQKNFRRIYEDSPRFIAAAALYPERQKALQEVLENMKKIEAAILRAEEMRRQNNAAGAWESIEKAAREFPDDGKLSHLRGELATHASDFVRSLRAAEAQEKREQFGASLSHYLKAQRLYPASDYAQEGIDRVARQILPPAHGQAE
jgi:hypothetical protein